MATTVHKSFCRVCGSVCGIEVEVENERVIRVRGDRSHPLTEGYTCSKGRGLSQIHHSPERLLVPKMRIEGELRQAEWTETLDDLGMRLRNIIAESGPAAVGVNLGGGGSMDASSYFFAREIPGILGTPAFYTTMTIDLISKIIVPEMVGGFGAVMTRPDYNRCRLVMYVGTNPIVSHGHTAMLNNPSRRMREMCERGEVWVLDPRKTETAAKATRHLAPRQNTDYAVLAFLVREILRDGADREYLKAHAQDVDRLAAAVEPFTVDAAAGISSIARGDLLDLLDAVRRAGRLSVETGTGLSMATSGNVTMWLSWALMIVTGSLDQEGGAWGHPGFLMRLEELLDLPPAPPEGWRGPGPKSRPELPSIMGEYPCVAIPDEIEAGHLRAIVNLSGNLVTSLPQTSRTVAALHKLDVLATIEILETPTAKISTHALPTKDQLERPDLSLAFDVYYPVLAGQYTPPIVKPLGECRSYWWILAQIGKRLGLSFIPGIDPDTAQDDDVLKVVAAKARCEWDDLRQNRYVAVDNTSLQFGWLLRLADRMGGWRVAPPELVKELAEIKPPAPLVLISRRPAHRLNSRVMDPRGGIPALHISPEDAAEAGLQDGSLAVVRSPHGSVKGIVKVDRTLRQGVMNVPHGLADDDNVNLLTSAHDVEPFTGMPRYSGMPVSLERIPGAVAE
jgi:anaerobic selenocysteine-containing dehydrogenase